MSEAYHPSFEDEAGEIDHDNPNTEAAAFRGDPQFPMIVRKVVDESSLEKYGEDVRKFAKTLLVAKNIQTYLDLPLPEEITQKNESSGDVLKVQLDQLNKQIKPELHTVISELEEKLAATYDSSDIRSQNQYVAECEDAYRHLRDFLVNTSSIPGIINSCHRGAQYESNEKALFVSFGNYMKAIYRACGVTIHEPMVGEQYNDDTQQVIFVPTPTDDPNLKNTILKVDSLGTKFEEQNVKAGVTIYR